MIRSKDLNEELKVLDTVAKEGDDEKTLLRSVVKGVSLMCKVLRDVRTNQVQYLRHLGVALIKPNVREDNRDKEAKVEELKEEKQKE